MFHNLYWTQDLLLLLLLFKQTSLKRSFETEEKGINIQKLKVYIERRKHLNEYFLLFYFVKYFWFSLFFFNWLNRKFMFNLKFHVRSEKLCTDFRKILWHFEWVLLEFLICDIVLVKDWMRLIISQNQWEIVTCIKMVLAKNLNRETYYHR